LNGETPLRLLRTSQSLLTLFRQAFQVKPYGVAHNAQFDAKFVATWLPDVAREINNPWFCTLRWLQDYLPSIGISPRQKGVAKLDNLCKYASYDLENAHEAFADALGCAAGLRWLSKAHPLTNELLPRIIVPCTP
jgi:DNA polymerase III epsilon subunit-like protein